MKNDRLGWWALMLAFLAMASIPHQPVTAQSSNDSRVQGVSTPGTTAAPRPVTIGGVDGGGLARNLVTDTNGFLASAGTTAAGSAASGNPTTVAGVDGTGTVRRERTDAGGVQLVSQGVNWLTDTITYLNPTASNGTTAVTIGPALVASQKVFPGKLIFYNVSTTAGHKVDILSSGGQILLEFVLGAGTTALNGGVAIIDNDAGSLASKSGEALQFKIDAGGSAADVTVSGWVVQKALN